MRELIIKNEDGTENSEETEGEEIEIFRSEEADTEEELLGEGAQELLEEDGYAQVTVDQWEWLAESGQWKLKKK